MKTISIKQPWAWLIGAGIKPIENRTWKCPEKYIGQRILIHASSSRYKNPFDVLTNQQYDSIDQDNRILANNSLEFGAIIGSVEIVGCVLNHESIWAEQSDIPRFDEIMDDLKFLGRVVPPKKLIYNWVLANPILFDKPITGVKGKLSFWDYDIENSINI